MARACVRDACVVVLVIGGLLIFRFRVLCHLFLGAVFPRGRAARADALELPGEAAAALLAGEGLRV